MYIIDKEAVLLWHRQELGLTLAMHGSSCQVGDNNDVCELMIEGCTNQNSLTKTYWAHSMRGSSKGACVWTFQLLSTCVLA